MLKLLLEDNADAGVATSNGITALHVVHPPAARDPCDGQLCPSLVGWLSAPSGGPQRRRGRRRLPRSARKM